MKRTVLLLAVVVFMLAGCVSNKAFKVEKEKVNVLEARQNKQDTELEVIRKDILAEKEKMEALIIRLNGVDEQLTVLEPMQAEIAATGEDVAFLQDEVSGAKDRMADMINDHNSLQQRVTDQGSAIAKEMELNQQANLAAMEELRAEIVMMAEDTDFTLEAFTDNLAEIRAIIKTLATKDELRDVINENEQVTQTLTGLTEEVKSVSQAGITQPQEPQTIVVAPDNLDESLGAINQRIDGLELEIGLIREEQLAQSQAMKTEAGTVKNDVASLRQRVESLSREISGVTTDLDNVIAQERAKKEKQRQLGIAAQYKNALAAYNKRKYEESIVMFEDFLAQYPSETLTPNAYYWIGENYYAGKKWSSALENFIHVRDYYPTHHKAADAMLKIGMCYYNMEMKDQAREEFTKLKDANPKYYRMDLVNKYLRLLSN